MGHRRLPMKPCCLVGSECSAAHSKFQMIIAVAEAMAGLTAMPVARVAANRAAMAKSVERKNISILLFRPGEAGWGWGDLSGLAGVLRRPGR